MRKVKLIDVFATLPLEFCKAQNPHQFYLRLLNTLMIVALNLQFTLPHQKSFFHSLYLTPFSEFFH